MEALAEGLASVVLADAAVAALVVGGVERAALQAVPGLLASGSGAIPDARRVEQLADPAAGMRSPVMTMERGSAVGVAGAVELGEER